MPTTEADRERDSRNQARWLRLMDQSVGRRVAARPTGKSVICPSTPSYENIPLSGSLDSPLQIPPSRPQRGVGHRHERWGGMRWTRQRRARLRSQGGFRERLCSAQDERRFNASAKTSAGCTRAFEGLVEVAAYGKAVWSWHPLLVSSWRRFS